MQDLFNFCAFTDNALITGLLMAIVALLAIIMVLDIRARRNEVEDDLLDINYNNNGENNINVNNEKVNVDDKVTEIKYVTEDAELEKTQAKIELENLKQELMKEEELKNKEEDVVSIENTGPEVPVETKIIDTNIEEVKDDTSTNVNTSADVIPMVNEVEIKEEVPVEVETIEQQVNRFEDEQESSAIISVEELQKRASELHGSEEVMIHEDEGNEPISLTELEALYKKAEVVEVKEEPIKEDLKEVSLPSEFKLDNSFKETHFTSSPIISPVYGIDETPRDNSLDNINLEQTANLDKLNDELKKVNEFLAALKELKSKL